MAKFVVTMTSTHSEDFEVEARSEQEAVEIICDMFDEGELEEEDRPWYNITFTCGRAKETTDVQSLI